MRYECGPRGPGAGTGSLPACLVGELSGCGHAGRGKILYECIIINKTKRKKLIERKKTKIKNGCNFRGVPPSQWRLLFLVTETVVASGLWPILGFFHKLYHFTVPWRHHPPPPPHHPPENISLSPSVLVLLFFFFFFLLTNITIPKKEKRKKFNVYIISFFL